jgi:hypothetical protein
MKTQKKNNRGLSLQARNKRWKWMVGATAATAAGVTASQASVITINLVGNYISSGGPDQNHLNADLTGDGHPDVTITNASNTGAGVFYFAAVNLNGVHASGVQHNGISYSDSTMRLGSRVAHFRVVYPQATYRRSYGTPSLMGSIPIFFKDLHINGGARTSGSLEVTVSGANIILDSFTYNSRAVPDQGSTLALLAMGAGGILALRRWRAARERS